MHQKIIGRLIVLPGPSSEMCLFEPVLPTSVFQLLTSVFPPPQAVGNDRLQPARQALLHEAPVFGSR